MAPRAALVGLLVVGCGAQAAATVPPQPAATAKAPEPKPVARWLLGRTSGFTIGRALKIGATSLVPGARGERWIVQENGSIVNAPTLLEGDLVAALAAPKGIDLVTATGDVLTVATPMGEVVAATHARRPFLHAAASDGAILALSPLGAIERSTDRGKTWSALDLERFGRALDVAMDRSGRALALLAPEGLIGSTDHGATWTRLALPVEDPEGVSIADDGLPYVGAPASGARWNGSAFLPAAKVEEDGRWLDEPAAGPIVASAMGAKKLLDVVLVEDEGPAKKLRYAVTALGGRRAWRSLEERCAHVVAAAHAEVFSFTCLRLPTAAETAPGPFVAVDFVSTDGGATFAKGPPRASGYDQRSQAYAVGPKGAAIVVSGIGRWSIRSASDKPFTALSSSGRPLAAVVDAKRARFVLLLVDGDARLHFGAIPFDATEVSTFAGEATIGYLLMSEPAALAIEGDVMVGTVSGSKELAVLRSKDGGATIERKTLPLGHATVSLAGARGLIESGGRLFQTLDFVASHGDAGPSPGLPLACSLEGCGAGFAMRLGWDHANRAPTIGEVEPPPTKSATAPLKVVQCTIGAKVGPAVGTFGLRESYDLDAGLRWFGDRAVVEGTADVGAKTITTLLPKGATKEQIVFHSLPNGVVAVRYRIPPKGKEAGLRPVSVDVAWQRKGDPKVRTARLGEVGTFRIAVASAREAERRWPWIVGIVDDGVLVQPTHPKAYDIQIGMASRYEDRDPIRYVHDDGKIDLLVAPEPIEIARVMMKTAQGWMLVPREPTEDGTLPLETLPLETTGDGKTWKRRSIRLWTRAPLGEVGPWFEDAGPHDESVGFGFSFVHGAPTWSIAPNDGPLAYVATLGPDRALEVASATISALDPPCGIASDDAVRAPYPLLAPAFLFDDGTPSGTQEANRVKLDGALLRISKSGACVRAIGGTDSAGDQVVIPLADPAHAWIARKHELHAMRCTLPK